MIVYALLDPDNLEIRYIGKTERTAHRRLKRHLSECYLKGETHKERWLRKLQRAGKKPAIVALEECSDPAQLNETERKHIAYFRSQGARLTNATDGGDGIAGFSLSAETRERISRALKGKPKTAEHRKNVGLAQLGREFTEVTRAKLRAIHSTRKRQSLSSAHRLSVSKGKNGRPFTDQHGTVYQTQHEAARLLGISQPHINHVLHGRRESVSGYKFSFVREMPR